MNLPGGPLKICKSEAKGRFQALFMLFIAFFRGRQAVLFALPDAFVYTENCEKNMSVCDLNGNCPEDTTFTPREL